MHTPEKLSLWDRWFNRYRREIHARGCETWRSTDTYAGSSPRERLRDWIDYKVIDRLNGSETIERRYLN